MSHSLRVLAAFLTFLALHDTAFAADAGPTWPQWRGPNRDGKSTETGLLKQWPAGGPKLEWKAKGLGGGYSSISIANGRIYTMGDGPDSANVMALELNGGKQIWSTKVGAPGGGGGYPGPRCTPTLDGDLVYVIGQMGDIVCVEAASGKEVWHKTMKEFGGKMMSGWGYAESPLVDGDKLICAPGGPQGAILALNKKTGSVIWQSKEYTDSAAYASLIVTDFGGVRQYIHFSDASVAGIAADDGKLLWKAPRKGATAVIPTPIFKDGLLFVTSGYKIGCNLFKITAENKQYKAEQVYANGDMVNHHGGVILVGDYVYGFSDGKGLTCMELKTGAVKWTSQSVGKGSLTFADGHLYLRAEGGPGSVALIEASPEAYKEKSRFDQPDRSKLHSWPHPVICGGKLYLRDQDTLLCYSVK